MAGCCDRQIGAVNPETFAERIISCANLAMAYGNTLLNDKALEILVVLRMNRSSMVYTREPFNMAVLVPDIEEAEGES
jgi:hypothetical protein